MNVSVWFVDEGNSSISWLSKASIYQSPSALEFLILHSSLIQELFEYYFYSFQNGFFNITNNRKEAILSNNEE